MRGSESAAVKWMVSTVRSRMMWTELCEVCCRVYATHCSVVWLHVRALVSLTGCRFSAYCLVCFGSLDRTRQVLSPLYSPLSVAALDVLSLSTVALLLSLSLFRVRCTGLSQWAVLWRGCCLVLPAGLRAFVLLVEYWTSFRVDANGSSRLRLLLWQDRRGSRANTKIPCTAKPRTIAVLILRHALV